MKIFKNETQTFYSGGVCTGVFVFLGFVWGAFVGGLCPGGLSGGVLS